MNTLNAWPVGHICAFYAQNPSSVRFVSLGTLPCGILNAKLQSLLIKKSASWEPQTLSHVNLVLQDGGIISPSSSDEDEDLQSTPFP